MYLQVMIDWLTEVGDCDILNISKELDNVTKCQKGLDNVQHLKAFQYRFR